MLAKTLAVIDRFYILLLLALILMAFLVMIIFKNIFQVLSAANATQQGTGNSFSINKDNLDKAYDLIFNKKIVSLD